MKTIYATCALAALLMTTATLAASEPQSGKAKPVVPGAFVRLVETGLTGLIEGVGRTTNNSQICLAQLVETATNAYVVRTTITGLAGKRASFMVLDFPPGGVCALVSDCPKIEEEILRDLTKTTAITKWGASFEDIPLDSVVLVTQIEKENSVATVLDTRKLSPATRKSLAGLAELGRKAALEQERGVPK